MFKLNYTKETRYVLLILRLSLGWLMFYAGITKLLEQGWSAAGFLQNATYGPFKELFAIMAGSLFVDLLVVWGLILIGITLILGVLVRWSSFWGAVMMLLFYFPTFPPEHGLIDEHIIYALVFVLFIVMKAGNIYGLDNYLEKTNFVKKNKWIKVFLG